MEEGLNLPIQNAIKAFRPDARLRAEALQRAEARMVCDAPYTPEKVLMGLYA